MHMQLEKRKADKNEKNKNIAKRNTDKKKYAVNFNIFFW